MQNKVIGNIIKLYNNAIILDANTHHTTTVLVLIPIFNLFSFFMCIAKFKIITI